MDLLGYGSPDVPTLVDVFKALCALDVPDDGLEFLATSVRGEDIREGNVYHGVRIRLTTRLVSALIPLQVDIGFGDAITPPAEELDFPTLLDFPAPRVLAYPKPVVVAEKFEALVTLGLANSRMKDFYDLWMLAQHSSFDGEVLRQALQATFDRRQMPCADRYSPCVDAVLRDGSGQTDAVGSIPPQEPAPCARANAGQPHPDLARVSPPTGTGRRPGTGISSHMDAGRTLAHPPTLVWQRLTGSMDTQDAVARSTTMVLIKSVSGRGPARVLYTARYA